ncbi:MAG TPA: Wzz/FepE/Etk N-terminal domain-containing protein [Candidatus Acidoferrales bacterium]
MAYPTDRRHGNSAVLPVTLRDLAAPIFRQRRLASFIFVGILAGAVVSALFVSRNYQAEMKILVNRDRTDPVVSPNPTETSASAPMPAVSEEDINSEVELLKSRDLIESVVLKCGLEANHDTLWDSIGDRIRGVHSAAGARLSRSVQAFENRLVVDPLQKTNLIRVAYTDRDPRLAARVLQTLATLYQEKHAAVHRPAGTFTFFDQQAARYRDDLATAEEKLTKFDRHDEVADPSAQKQLQIEKLAEFQAELEQDRVAAYAAAERARALRVQAEAAPERQTTQTRTLDNAELLAHLEDALVSLELKRTEMLIKYAPGYPLVRAIETEIQTTQKAIAEARQAPVEEITTDRVPAQDWRATELAKTEADRVQLTAHAAAAAHVVRHYQEVSQRLGQEEAAQDDLARAVKIAEANYLLYSQKREEARISDALDRRRIVNVSIAEAATAPAFPVQNLGWLLMGGFFMASITSVGSAYAVDRLDPSFRTPGELGRYLEITVLASIPESTSGE